MWKSRHGVDLISDDPPPAQPRLPHYESAFTLHWRHAWWQLLRLSHGSGPQERLQGTEGEPPKGGRGVGETSTHDRQGTKETVSLKKVFSKWQMQKRKKKSRRKTVTNQRDRSCALREVCSVQPELNHKSLEDLGSRLFHSNLIIKNKFDIQSNRFNICQWKLIMLLTILRIHAQTNHWLINRHKISPSFTSY